MKLLGSYFPASRRRVAWERLREWRNQHFCPFVIW